MPVLSMPLPRRPAARWALAALLGAGSLLALAGLLRSEPAQAQAAAGPVDAETDKRLRKVLSERLPGLPRIDEIRPTPIPGLFELRIGSDLVYGDASGQYLVQGQIIETASRRNLTEERINKLTAVDFASLPLKDAIVWKTGNGKRRIAVFSDPNCGYCKRFEAELSKAKDLTVYTFLMPILSEDSATKSKAIWCAKDSTATWRSWMLDGVNPARTAADCANPIERNLELGRKLKVNGTPAIVFEDGTRVPGMVPAAELERRLGEIAKGG